jgi:hypothetical protein
MSIIEELNLNSLKNEKNSLVLIIDLLYINRKKK